MGALASKVTGMEQVLWYCVSHSACASQMVGGQYGISPPEANDAPNATLRATMTNPHMAHQNCRNGIANEDARRTPQKPPLVAGSDVPYFLA